MNIGVNLIQYTDMQGIEIFTLNLLGAAVKKNPNERFVIFVNKKSKELFSGVAAKNVDFIEAPKGALSSFRLIVLQQWWLPRACRRNGVEVLWCPSVAIPLWYGRKVVTVHDCADARFPEESKNALNKIYLYLVRFFVKLRSLKVVTISEFSRSEIAAIYGIPLDNIMVVSVGVPELPARDQGLVASIIKRWNLHENYFFYIGNIRPRKNIRRLLDAFAIFLKQHGDAQLVLAGRIDTNFFNVSEYARRIGIENAVAQIGFVSDEEKVELYCGSVALVFPSLYEGFGLPVLEAQSVGVPVVTARSSSLEESGGKGVIFVDPYSAEDIAHGMNSIFSDDELRKNIIAAGYENIKRFSWEKAAEKLMAVLRSTVVSERGNMIK